MLPCAGKGNGSDVALFSYSANCTGDALTGWRADISLGQLAIDDFVDKFLVIVFRSFQLSVAKLSTTDFPKVVVALGDVVRSK